MMSKERDLLKEALEAGDSKWYFGTELLTKIENFLAQPEPETWMWEQLINDIEYLITAFEDGADADDYWRPISDLREDLQIVKLYKNDSDTRLAFEEASRLALMLHKKFYQKVSPNFELCDSTAGIISQIDNMVCTLVEAPSEEPEQDLKREPLSDEVICEILLKKEWKGFVELTRQIEKEHGIGVSDE